MKQLLNMEKSMNNKKSGMARLKDYIFDSENQIYLHPQNDFLEYVDGAEKYIFEIFKKHPSLFDYPHRLIKYIRDWPTRYNLSPRRTNLLESITEIITKKQEVLEIGCGTGVLTKWLGEKCKKVTAIEGSLPRAKLAKRRTKNLKNVDIYCGDILKTSLEDAKYDLITLIGVFEYISSSSEPMDFLKRISKALKKYGILLIAIENKLGIKYLSGCTEDHTGKHFQGIIGYPNGKTFTFSRSELKELLNKAGFQNIQFYHLFPDYKLLTTIIREVEEVLNLYPENWINAPFEEYLKERYYIFPELLFLKSLIRARLLFDFSNSFLILASQSKGVPLASSWLIKKFFTHEGFQPKFHHTISLIKKEDNYWIKRTPLPSGEYTTFSGKTRFNVTPLSLDSGRNVTL